MTGPKFSPPPGRIRRFGEPTHTTTYATSKAPCGGKVKVFNEAYERPVEVECDGDHEVLGKHRYAIVVHHSDDGFEPVCFFAELS